MTRRGRFSARMTLVQADGPISIPADACTTIFLALCNLTLEVGKMAIALKPLDAAALNEPMPDDNRLSCSRSGGGQIGLYIIHLFPSREPKPVWIEES